MFWSIGFSNRPWPFIFIWWGGLIPQEILFTDLNLWKTLIVLGLYMDLSDRSDLPVRPVGPCRTGHSASTGQTARSDRLVPILAVNICPMFFGKACLPKNILLSQNCLRSMINTTSAIFCTKGDKQLSAMFCSSRCWNNLFGPPHLLHCRWCLWHGLHLLFHCLLLAHMLQPSLLSMRQAWGTPPRL